MKALTSNKTLDSGPAQILDPFPNLVQVLALVQVLDLVRALLGSLKAH